MDLLYHYVIVREDLPIGVKAAMLIHAAGESSRLIEHLPTNTYAVALQATGDQLLYLEQDLIKLAFRHVVVVETPPSKWSGQKMSIGIQPLPKSVIGPLLRHLKTLR